MIYYNVEIQMSGTNETSQHLVEQIASYLGAPVTAIDELETYRAVIFFQSPVVPSEIFQRVRKILDMYRMTLHYIDIIYRYENQMTPYRKCIWSDGTEKEYDGHVEFVEVKP